MDGIQTLKLGKGGFKEIEDGSEEDYIESEHNIYSEFDEMMKN